MKSTLTDEYVEFRRADHKETVCLLSQALRYLPSVFSYLIMARCHICSMGHVKTGPQMERESHLALAMTHGADSKALQRNEMTTFPHHLSQREVRSGPSMHYHSGSYSRQKFFCMSGWGLCVKLMESILGPAMRHFTTQMGFDEASVISVGCH